MEGVAAQALADGADDVEALERMFRVVDGEDYVYVGAVTVTGRPWAGGGAEGASTAVSWGERVADVVAGPGVVAANGEASGGGADGEFAWGVFCVDGGEDGNRDGSGFLNCS